MSNADLKGVITASLTPVTAQFDVDGGRLAAHCRRLLDEGCSFISAFGTTGEGSSLSTGQKIDGLVAYREAGGPLDKLIPAIMTSKLDEAARLVAASAEMGCRAVLVLPPYYYNTPTDDGILAFFDAMLERAGNPGIDMLLYSIPVFSGVPFTPSLIDRLIARFGERIVGVKDSTGSRENALMLAERYPSLSIFTGDDRVMPELVTKGGAGMIGGMPNVFAADACAVYSDPASEATALKRKRAGQRIEIVDSNGSLVVLKAAIAAQYGDPDWARVVPPLVGLDPIARADVFAALAGTGYDPQATD
ncbi:dihydrodipicolinate synthase family protein [Cucumibacter marinus]|uniref:dihydrodipicolinate synthase family protein n=1 Tax=Cucumibacter marinus TaxID=1121252 RepID=UPI0003F881DF|nr:dihydrodipicolinate synthase family protein [Cucumibacter marinus]